MTEFRPGDLVEYFGSVAIVRRVLEDINGTMLQVQRIGDNSRNLKYIDIEDVNTVTVEDAQTEAVNVVQNALDEVVQTMSDIAPEFSVYLRATIQEGIDAIANRYSI